MNAMSKHLEEQKNLRQQGSTRWWKVLEACFLAFGQVSEEIAEAVESGYFTLDTEGYFRNVVLETVSYHGFFSFLFFFFFFCFSLFFSLRFLHRRLKKTYRLSISSGTSVMACKQIWFRNEPRSFFYLLQRLSRSS